MRGCGAGCSVLVAVLAVHAGQSAVAQELGERCALIVGVHEYAKTRELRDLNYSDRDMKELGEALRDGGCRPENIVLMTQVAGAENTRYRPIAANIRKELTALLRDRTKADSVLIAFAGHRER